MSNQVKIWMILFAASTLILTACKKDEPTINPLEQFALEQNEEFGHSARTCGLQQHMDKLLTDPNYNEKHQAKFARLENELSNIEQRAACATPKVIPVAVHFQGVNGIDIACLRQLAQSQIDILNNDYAGTNSDITKWDNQAANSFPGVSNGDACLRFCIADKNHPSGFSLSNGTPAVTLNQTSGDSNPQWSGYLNIYVRPNTGVLGYSPLGGSGNGDGVVIDAAAFGAGNGCGSISPQSPYDLGRTLTHELGHYLLLDHIWGNGGCNQDDGVADTPSQASDNNGCPSLSTTSCGSRDMHMNYMDYTNDACMYMFSAGQVARMEGYVNSSLANLTNNAANKCSDVGDGGGGNGDTCDKPTQTNATNIASTQATITWSAVSGATNYQVRYRKSGTTTWTTQSTTATSRTITSLTANTTYQYQVRARCDATWTGWTAAKTFTTTANQSCSPPAQTNATNITASQAKITWSAVSGASLYQVRYRKSGTSSWTNKNTTATSRTITGLAANTTYQYRVRARCGATWTGFTPIKTFTTTGGGNGCNGQQVTIKLTLDDYGSETSWELVNANYNTVATGGPYADNQAGAVKSKTVCVPNGCYTLYLDDAYGDGICCDYGDGSLQVIHNASVVGNSDGYFGYYDVIDFCVDNSNIVVTGQNRDDKVISAKKKTSID